MPVIRTGETQADKELALWDRPRSQGGYRPDGYQPYPKMVYKARQRDDGVVVCLGHDPRTGEQYPGTWRIVPDREAHDRATREGWVEDPRTALEVFERARQGVALAAAEEAYRLERMSPQAQAEHAAANAASEEHVVEVPIPKLRPRSHRKRPSPDPVSP